jgi:hypothetical protein
MVTEGLVTDIGTRLRLRDLLGKATTEGRESRTCCSRPITELPVLNVYSENGMSQP